MAMRKRRDNESQNKPVTDGSDIPPISIDSDEFDTGDDDETGGNSKVFDLTGKFKQPSGISKTYRSPSEYVLAMYAVTQFVNRFGKIVRNSRAINGEPTVNSISTDVRTLTTVYSDVCATVEIPKKDGKTITGIIQSILLDDGYRVSLAGPTKEDIDFLERTYNKILEKSNFYQGKTLRFGRDAVEFIAVPSTELEDTILPEGTTKEYKLNIIEFLTNPAMQAITKKRGMLLYGAPGTGKTSSIKAMFKILFKKGITCVYVSDASFERQSVEDIFTFINKYLAPALVVFEDIDLITPDRRDGASRLIGPLLSALNGIEEQEKPIVILATTNRVEVLDAAVTRPCRFDRRIEVGYPTEGDMHKIFKKVAGFEAPKGCFGGSEPKMTGAHVEEIYRTAALLAEQAKKPIEECVEEAVATVKKHFMIVSPKVAGFGSGDDDRKLGEPVGLSGSCGRASRPGSDPMKM
jgi:hypothetical protein